MFLCVCLIQVMVTLISTSYEQCKSCMNESALKFSDHKLDELTRSAPPLGSSIVVLAL